MDSPSLRILGLIPARGGSKGVPRKSVRLLSGKPLLAYTAEAALAARSLSRVILSTDDPEIAAVGRELGIEVPFVRPGALAADDTPMLPVVQHAVRELAALGDHYDAVCLLQPTAPLRRAEDIEGCIALLAQRGADAVVTVRRIPPEYSPHWAYLTDADGALRLATGDRSPIPRRQELPPAYHRDGSVYLVRTSVVLVGNSLYGKRVFGYEVDSADWANIDTLDDWHRAERLLQDVSKPR
jgi:CMP-N-acetylneuraminic acid synthetase